MVHKNIGVLIKINKTPREVLKLLLAAAKAASKKKPEPDPLVIRIKYHHFN